MAQHNEYAFVSENRRVDEENFARSLDNEGSVSHYVPAESRWRNVAHHREQFVAAPNGPVPPAHLRHRTCGTDELRDYLASGHLAAKSIDDLIRSRIVAVKSDARVLDFGCAPGRVTMWLHERHRDWNLFGTDTDAEAIAWAQSNLASVAKFHCNLPAPPLNYYDGYFDLVIAFSVFTDPADELESAWFDELMRITRPGGHMLISIAGCHEKQPVTSSATKFGRDRTLYRHRRLSTDFIRHAWGERVRIEHIVANWLGQDLAMMICRR